MLPSFNFNDWYPVVAGPSTGRLILAILGERDPDREDEEPNLLDFTIAAAEDRRRSTIKLGILFEGLSCDPRYVKGEKEFRVTGYLFSIHRSPIKIGRTTLPVTIEQYAQSKRDKGYASLKVSDTVGYDPFDII